MDRITAEPGAVRDAEELRRRRHRRFSRRAAAAFFLCMLIFTIISRVLDSYRVARVRVGACSQGSLTKTVSGAGILEAGETQSVRLLSGLRVGRIEISPGAPVAAGDPLFYYDVDSLTEMRRALLKEIRKLELENESERLGAVSYKGVTGTELAGQELAAAEAAYARQQEKTAQAEAEYLQNLEELKAYYEKRLELSEKELLDQSRDDFNQSRNDYETAELGRDAELRSLRRKIKDTERKLQKLQDKENPDAGDEEKLEELEDLLEQYEEELDAASDRWDLALMQAEEDRDEKEDLYDRAGRETDSAKLELQESYKAAVKKEEQQLDASRESEADSARALERAGQAVENARKEDQAAELTQEQAKRLAELHCASRQMDIDEKRGKLSEIEALIDGQGAVLSPAGGTALTVELEPGKELAGTERLLLSKGNLRLRGSFDREEDLQEMESAGGGPGGKLDVGDEVQIRLEGGESPFMAAVAQVDLVTDGEKGIFFAGVPSGIGSLGEKASYECRKKTDIYPSVIPLSALRRGSEGDFCLILREHRTILGEEYRAEKVALKVLFAGDSKAAVDGALSTGDRIITASDRIISAGDRVRLIVDLNEGRG